MTTAPMAEIEARGRLVAATSETSDDRALVLIVDDDESMRLLVRETVEAFGFRALDGANGDEALAAFKRSRPDVVLLDVLMPGMDGFETCRALRSEFGAVLTPIVMMTGLNDVESIGRAYEAGATDFITKPVNYVLLGHRLRYILRAKQTVDELRSAERRLANAQHIASLGSWEIDLTARTLQVSDELYRVLGMDRGAFGGRPAELWSTASPEDRARVARRFEHAVGAREPLRLEYRVSGPAGERTIHQEAEVAEDEEGGRVLLVGTAQDITERRRAEQKVVQLSVLSDTVKVIAGSADFEALVEQLAPRLRHALGASLVAVCDWPNEDDPPRVLPAPGSGALDQEQLALMETARRTSSVAESRDRERVACAIPMVVRGATIGCFYASGPSGSLATDGSDIAFLQSLAQPLAVALDRARLSEQYRRRQKRECLQLKEEIAELRETSGQVELVYRSRAMRQMFEAIERIAPTDATVLITGENGTGKDLVAHALYRLSGRRKKPLVVVDCAALPTTLIESELFGHEKGAYTGAQERKIGRLAEANGGTVVLDEIGELPLEVQSKLLRFVQEREISPVGGTRTLQVDARVIAVTNRDLAAEIAARRFREDLYHRLNVIRIRVPSLRDRREDVPLLANHFLKVFARQYQKPPLHFSPEAEAAIARHAWTGNVRELRNRVLQAVVLAENAWIGPELIELDASRSVASGPRPRVPVQAPSASEIWDGLRASLRAQLEDRLESPEVAIRPLGRWMTQDLVREAHDAAGGVLSRAAAILGIPEATYRRQYRKIEAEGDHDPGVAPTAGWRTVLAPVPGPYTSLRGAEWMQVRRHIRELVHLGDSVEGDRTRRARDVLLEEVLQLVPENAVDGAAFMGVSPPTFRRWMRRRRST